MKSHRTAIGLVVSILLSLVILAGPQPETQASEEPASEAPAPGVQALEGKTFYFGTHPARTTLTFVSEADLETIHGVTHVISGSLAVDKEGKHASGTLRVPVASMKTGIDLRDEHMRSDTWLDAAKYPEIRLDLLEAVVGDDGKTWTYKANITIKGVTRKLEGSARVFAYDEKVAKVLGPGSWIRVRTDFEVTLSDFGVKIPETVLAKVSKTWAIGVDIYGTTAPPKKGE